MPKSYRQRKDSSSEDENDQKKNTDNSIAINEKIDELRFIQKQRQKIHGIDVYSLAIGESVDSTATIENDPWKTKTGGLVDMRVVKEKRGNEIVKNMHSNFARETNQRDEDAEMQKFIEDQVRLKKRNERLMENSSIEKTMNTDEILIESKQFKSPEDALFDVPKYLIESQLKNKTVELLSDQMLSGIPEVELGLEERIRNIEETERAKQAFLDLKKQHVIESTEIMLDGFKSKNSNFKHIVQANNCQYAPQNTSMNFVQHKRFDDALINPDHMIKPKIPSNKMSSQFEYQPVVGDAPKHDLLANNPTNSKSKSNKIVFNQKADDLTKIERSEIDRFKTKKKTSKRLNNVSIKQNNNNFERATDDYCWERFRKNARFGKNSKIKIA